MIAPSSHHLFRRAVVMVVLSAFTCLAGCASYAKKTGSFVKLYEDGQYAEAVRVTDETVGAVPNPNQAEAKPAAVDRNAPAQALAPAATTPTAAPDATSALRLPDLEQLNKSLKVAPRDGVVYRLDQAQVLRTAGRLDESRIAFFHAGEMFDRFDEQPEVQISREVGAALTNLTYMDYRGYAYDRLAMEMYRAMIDMQLGDLDDARIAFRALQQRQDEAEEHFRKKIEATEAKNEKADQGGKSGDSVDVDRTKQDPKFSQSLQAAYGEDVPAAPDRSAYKNYSNPFAEYLMGIYFMSAGLTGSDAETAVTAFKRVQGMTPNNTYVAEDLTLADSVANGKRLPPTTYIFFETGMAPTREEIRIDIPIFLVSLAASGRAGNVPYVGAAFPKLKFRSNYVTSLNVQAGDKSYQTALLSDMDQIIKKDFDNELPLVITRTIIAVATKAAASYGINKGTESNGYAHLAALIGTTVYQAGMNSADLRMWETLPKQFQIARFPTPANRQIILTLANGVTLPPITLTTDAVINIVYVKSVQPGAPLIVTQYKLK